MSDVSYTRGDVYGHGGTDPEPRPTGHFSHYATLGGQPGRFATSGVTWSPSDLGSVRYLVRSSLVRGQGPVPEAQRDQCPSGELQALLRDDLQLDDPVATRPLEPVRELRQLPDDQGGHERGQPGRQCDRRPDAGGASAAASAAAATMASPVRASVANAAKSRSTPTTSSTARREADHEQDGARRSQPWCAPRERGRADAGDRDRRSSTPRRECRCCDRGRQSSRSLRTARSQGDGRWTAGAALSPSPRARRRRTATHAARDVGLRTLHPTGDRRD